MTLLHYTLLHQPGDPIVLTLHRTAAGWYSVTDQHGSLYFPPTPNGETCLRFMRAFVELTPGASSAPANRLEPASPPDTLNVIPLPSRKDTA